MRRNPPQLPDRSDTEPVRSDPTVSASPAGNHRARNQSAFPRAAPPSGFRVGIDRQTPHCAGLTECDRNVRLPATQVPRRAIGAVTPRLAGTSPGDRVRRSESRHRRGHSRNSRRGLCCYPPGSLGCDLHAKGTAPSIGRGSVAAPGANPARADSPSRESVLSSRRWLRDSRTSCLDGQNTAERGQIPRNDGGDP